MDETKLKDLLETEIGKEIGELSYLKPGSDEHVKAVESLTKLYKVNIERAESERASREQREQEVDREKDWLFKNAQLEEQRKDRYFKLGVDAAGILIPIVFYGIWMHKGFKFEESGTYTSQTFRNLFNRFRPTK